MSTPVSWIFSRSTPVERVLDGKKKPAIIKTTFNQNSPVVDAPAAAITAYCLRVLSERVGNLERLTWLMMGVLIALMFMGK